MDFTKGRKVEEEQGVLFDCLEDHSRGLMNNISEASDRFLDVFLVRGTA
jgi:hypothetical protein